MDEAVGALCRAVVDAVVEHEAVDHLGVGALQTEDGVLEVEDDARAELDGAHRGRLALVEDVVVVGGGSHAVFIHGAVDGQVFELDVGVRAAEVDAVDGKDGALVARQAEESDRKAVGNQQAVGIVEDGVARHGHGDALVALGHKALEQVVVDGVGGADVGNVVGGWSLGIGREGDVAATDGMVVDLDGIGCQRVEALEGVFAGGHVVGRQVDAAELATLVVEQHYLGHGRAGRPRHVRRARRLVGAAEGQHQLLALGLEGDRFEIGPARVGRGVGAGLDAQEVARGAVEVGQRVGRRGDGPVGPEGHLDLRLDVVGHGVFADLDDVVFGARNLAEGHFGFGGLGRHRQFGDREQAGIRRVGIPIVRFLARCERSRERHGADCRQIFDFACCVHSLLC